MRRRRKDFFANTLVSMLDMLSGTFACTVVLFVVFASLRQSNSAAEAKTFLFVRASAVRASAQGEGRASTQGEVKPLSEFLTLKIIVSEEGTPFQSESGITAFPITQPRGEDAFDPLALATRLPGKGTTVSTAAMFSRINGQFLVEVAVNEQVRPALYQEFPSEELTFELELVYSHGTEVRHERKQLRVNLEEVLNRDIKDTKDFQHRLSLALLSDSSAPLGRLISDDHIPTGKDHLPPQAPTAFPIVLSATAKVTP